MKKIIFLALFMSLYVLAQGQKTYVMHYLPILTGEQVGAYQGYDMIVVDHEVINTSAANLRRMRQDNPELLILVYSEKMQWHNPMYPDKPWSILMVEELKKYPKWFLLDAKGKNMTFWPGTIMMNCRLDGPRYQIGKKSYSYIEFFTERYINDIIGTYHKEGIRLDGILDDDLFKEISFLGEVDGNRDGVPDEKTELNRQWRLGNAYFLEKVREKMGKDFLIIGNGGHRYYLDWCNGKQMEHFPEIYIGSWLDNMNNANTMEIALFNARTGEENNWFFTLCSSMLLDNTWFSFGQNTPYETKYDLKMGQPKGAFFQNSDGTFSRLFEKGKVTVDYQAERAWINK